MSRITHRERYINTLLKLNANITQMVRTEIDEIFHDRGRPSEEMECDLKSEIEQAFSNGTAYKCKKQGGANSEVDISNAIQSSEYEEGGI